MLGLITCVATPAAWASPAHGAARNSTLTIGAVQAAHPSYKYNYSRIAWTGSHTVIAATDIHGDLYYFWEVAGSTKWHSQEVAKAKRNVSYGKPSIAWTGHAVLIVALNASGALVSFTQHAGSSKWHYQQVAKVSGGHIQAPSVAVIPGGTVLVSAANTKGTLMSYTLPAGSSTWTALRVAYGSFGGSSIAICYDSIVGHYLGLITATSGGYLYFWWERADIPGWNEEVIAVPGPGGSYSGSAVSASSDQVLVTAAGTDGSIYFWAQAIGGSGWAQETPGPANGTSYSHPAIAWTGPVGLESYDVITATNAKGQLDYWWKQDNQILWNPEKIAVQGKHAAYASPAVSVTSKSVIVTAINSKTGDVNFWYQPFTTNPWHKQLVAKG